jgi:hypothetical protein
MNSGVEELKRIVTQANPELDGYRSIRGTARAKTSQ